MSDRSVVAFLVALSFLAGSPGPLGANEPHDPIDVGFDRQIFLDDFVIDSTRNVEREWHQPQRDPHNPVMAGDRPWEAWVVEAHGRPVVYDPQAKHWKMYYVTWVPDRNAAFHQRYLACVATSANGTDWHKPELGQYEWNGSRDNNILDVGQENWMRRVNVIHDDQEVAPGGRFKMTFVDVVDGKTAIVRAASADGLRWGRLGDPWFNSGFGHNLNLLGWDPRHERYVLLPRVVEEGRVGVGRSTSKDFVTWTAPEPIIIPEQDESHLEFKGLAAFPYEGIYLGCLWVFEGVQRAESELAYSRDGVQWSRPNRGKLFFPRGRPQEWDCEMVLPTAPIVRGDELWFYYTGWNFPYGPGPLTKVRKGWLEDSRRMQRSVGIARLRLDGFVSLSARDEEGTVTTRPFEFAGDGLRLNIDAAEGAVGVEVLDASHAPIPGFSGEAALWRERFDDFRWQPQWPRDLSILRDRTVRLRFHLKNARLYAFQVVQAPARERESAIDIGSRLEPMVDDFLIDRFEGDAQPRLHSPTPREEVMRFDKPWEGNTTSYVETFHPPCHPFERGGPGGVDPDRDGRYRMFYRGWDFVIAEKLSQGHSAMICYAESQDGIRWERPNLGLVTFRNSRDNNIVDFPGKIGEFSTVKSTFTVSIDENPNCHPEGRYKGFVLALDAGDKTRGLIPLQSADGKVWKPITDRLVITGDAFDSPNRLFWDPVRQEYRAYWRAIVNAPTKDATGNGGRRDIKTATSQNLIDWSPGELLTYPGADQEQLYTNMIFPYHRAPHLFVGFPTRYLDRGWSDSMRALPDLEHRERRAKALPRAGTALTDTLFMVSRDGREFQRFGEAFIRPGPERPGTWNYSHTHVSCPLLETKSSLPGAPNELSFYVTEDYWTGKGGSALRRYTLRMDGFASVHAKASGGGFVTKPLTFTGTRLSLNFATSAAGSIRVEVLSADGRPVPGFTLQDCGELFGDSLDRTVSWTKGTDVSVLRGSPIRLRFAMKDADLYALRFCD